MKKHILSLLTGTTLMLAACTNDATESVVAQPEADGNATQLAFTAKDFVPADGQSRTAFIGNSFSWVQTSDTIGILPDAGAQVYFVIKDLTEDAKSATFTGEAWGLKSTNDYTAYYPFIQDIMLDRNAVPVDYSVQSYKYQTNDDGDVVVCPSHDYMAAKSVRAESGNLNFQFSHLGALVKVQFTLPEAAEVKRFYLSSDQAVFPVKGTFDLTPEEGAEVAITPDNENLAYTVTVNVEDLETAADGETVSVYFMMPPMSLEGLDMKATVVYGENNKTLPLTVSKTRPTPTVDGETEYTQFEAGKSYTLESVVLPENIDISEVSSLSSAVNTALGTLGGTKLRFVTGSTVESETVVYTDANGVNAYAVRNDDWLEVHTLAQSFKLPESAEDMFSTSSFTEFANLTELDLSGFDTSSVTDMSYMFRGCSSLAMLDLSSFDTEQVTDMSRMFWGCSSLTSLDLGCFDTSSVTDMSYMFANCTALTTLTLGKGFVTSSVTDMSNMFEECSSLNTLDLRNFDTFSVEKMGSMFWGCSSLTSLDLSNFNTANVKTMSYMFANCTALTTLTLGAEFDTSSVTDMGSMFFKCSSLASLDLSRFNTVQVTYMADMFSGCSSLTTLDLTSFTFVAAGSYNSMFTNVGYKSYMETGKKNATIYVSGAGYGVLTAIEKSGTDLGLDYAELWMPGGGTES